MNKYRLRLLSFVVIAYMLLAFGWWSVLLFITNKDAYQAKTELADAKIELATSKQELLAIMDEMGVGQKIDLASREQKLLYEMGELESRKLILEEKYTSQAWMILGESIVFMIILIFGIYLIDRGYRQEVSAEKQRRNFLLSITHELKSPLASIQLMLETFLKRDLHQAAIHKLSKSGLKETQRLNNLVNDLLFSARLEEAFQPNLQEVDLSLLANDLVHEMEEKFPAATFELIEENEIPMVEGDLLGMVSVLTNLLENAIKYGKEHPIIQLRLAHKNQKINIQVADNGIGIPDKEKKMIFDKFYRVGNEDTRKTKGTGLGLYLVKQILKAHQGMITAKDNKPEGTIMDIKLPVSQSKPAKVKNRKLENVLTEV